MENNQDNNSVSEVQILKDGLDFLFQRVQYINQTLAGLPSDVSSQRVLDLELDQQLTSISNRIYKTSSSILELASGKGSEQLKPSFEDLMEGQMTSLTDVTDSLFERVDIGLDHIRAQTNSSEKAGFSLQKQNFVTTFQPNEQGQKAPLKFLAAKNLNRPQVFFTDKIDNSVSTHFVSWVYRNMSKPHAIAPLDTILPPLFDNKSLEEITLKELESKSLPHPYEYEIRNYQASESVLSKDDTQVSLSMDEVPLYFIETVEQLEEILPKLLNAKELAIDLEHHDYLTYQGFTCLMQISTRTEDFIIDTLKLRKELFVLNQVFANPQIVKVLHGADFDVIWLQRDFGLYIVGLFDTYQACKLLNTDQKSLAYLLKNKTQAQFEADKKYQLADWRIRPLTKEMINYARADTHYLLEIYDNMKTELLENTQPNHPSQIYTVLDWSAEVALKKHEKPVIDFEFGLGPNGWSKILKKFNVPLTPRQVEAFKYLHRWRDMIARQQDDSVRYVLPDHLLIKFATNMPTSTSEVFKLCDVVPNIVRSDATEIVNIINESKQALLAETEQLADTAKGAVSSVTAGVENISIDSEKPHRPLADVLPPNLVVTDLTKQHSQLFGTGYKFTGNFHAATRNAQVDQILSNLRFSPLPDNVKIIFDEVANPDDEVVYKKPKREAEEAPINLDPKVYQLSASIETTKPNEELISEPQLHRGSENIVNPEDAIPSSGYDYEAELDKMTKELAAPSAKKSKFLNNTKNSFNPQNEIVDTIPQPKKKANHNEKGNRSIYVKKGKK